jgi:pimeloyl-ACP methyl ester carboxylesterase
MRTLYKNMHAGPRPLAQKLFLSAFEGPRIGREFVASQLLKKSLRAHSRNLPNREGHGVLVLPGFLSRDRFNQPLIKFLNSLGYVASGWKNGRNVGPRSDVLVRLTREIEFKFQLTQQKISLVGHSLGGVYARELARAMPDKVEQVITLASPFSRSQSNDSVTSKLYQTLNANQPAATGGNYLEKELPVPSTCVYTRSDSVIDWRSARQDAANDSKTQNIEVYGSHCGLTVNPAVWFLLTDRLAQSADQWAPFNNDSWRRALYPQVS